MKTNYGPIGQITDMRTYRRFIPELKRRETDRERNERVANYSVGLLKNCPNYESLDKEAIEDERFLMMEMMGELNAWPSGRTAWVGGTKSAELNPVSQFNCSAAAINSPVVFSRIFNLLALGVGVGFRVFYRDIEQLPKIEGKDIEFISEPYQELPKSKRLESTSFLVQNQTGYLTVGDSREGWGQAIDFVIDSYLENGYGIQTLKVNYNSVRPYGERIKGFGGRASGHEALQFILEEIARICRECPTDKLRSLDCMDIVCAIAKGVVAGNTRRSALLCLFEEGDKLIREAKVGLFSNPALANKQYRTQSNNTEAIGSSRINEIREFLINNPTLNVFHSTVLNWLTNFIPSEVTLRETFESIKGIGEPGFCNYARMVAIKFYAAIEHRPHLSPEEIFDLFCSVATNPCFEIILSVGSKEEGEEMIGLCNLTTLPLPNFVHNQVLDYEELDKAVRLITRIGLRQTLVNMPEPYLDIIQKRERLLGVSITGWQDAFQLLKWEYDSNNAVGLRILITAIANKEATRYAEELGVERPLLVTALKPEGTGSTVFGTSSGVHWDYSPYYFRRVRMAAMDAVACALNEQGYTWYPEVEELDAAIPTQRKPQVPKWALGLPHWLQKCLYYFQPTPAPLSIKDKVAVWEKEGPIGSLEDYKTVVFSFPVKSNSKVGASEVSAKDQFKNTQLFAQHYADHMVSSTITVKPDEWEDCIQMVLNNWEWFTNTSFLSYYESDYPLLPFEPCTKAQYVQGLNRIPEDIKIPISNDRVCFYLDPDLVAYWEGLLEKEEDEELVESSSCPTGTCPIR